MPALKLFAVVRLKIDLPEEGLSKGAKGAVVDLLSGSGEAYEVEFVGPDGYGIAATVRAEDLEPDDA